MGKKKSGTCLFWHYTCSKTLHLCSSMRMFCFYNRSSLNFLNMFYSSDETQGYQNTAKLPKMKNRPMSILSWINHHLLFYSGRVYYFYFFYHQLMGRASQTNPFPFRAPLALADGLISPLTILLLYVASLNFGYFDTHFRPCKRNNISNKNYDLYYYLKRNLFLCILENRCTDIHWLHPHKYHHSDRGLMHIHQYLT